MSDNGLRKINIKRNFLKYPEGSCLIEMGDTIVLATASIEEKVPPFLKKMGITYPVYLPQEDLIRSFGVRTIPHNVVYGPDGVMQANQPGYVDGESLKAFIDSLLEHK